MQLKIIQIALGWKREKIFPRSVQLDKIKTQNTDSYKQAWTEMGGRRETQHLYKISKLLFWGLGMPILPCCTPFDLREALFFFTDMCLANMSPHDTDSYHGTRSSSPVHGCPSLHDKNDRSNENMPHAPYICTIPTFLQVCCMIACHHRSGIHQSLASRNMYPAWILDM